MSTVRKAHMGDALQIHYICRSAEGVLLETTHETPPPVIRLGAQDIIPALEEAFIGMGAGESKHVQLTPKQAFGPYLEELVAYVPTSQLDLKVIPQPGMQVEVADSDNEPMLGRIVEVGEDSVLVDCNHPLAGETLEYDLTLVAFSEDNG